MQLIWVQKTTLRIDKSPIRESLITLQFYTDFLKRIILYQRILNSPVAFPHI